MIPTFQNAFQKLVTSCDAVLTVLFLIDILLCCIDSMKYLMNYLIVNKYYGISEPDGSILSKFIIIVCSIWDWLQI